MATTDRNDSPGQIITFYSYKGGTGRSMAVANIACLLGRELARTSQRVLVMDWDLEAPGLHRYFSARCDLPQFRDQEGVANYFHALRGLVQDSPDLYQALTAPEGCKVLEERLPLEPYITPNVVPGVDFMRAGRFNSDYPRLASSFNWIDFYTQFGSVIRTFREMLAENYAYILIDSRTGITDVSGICTTLLPEKLVGVFVPNRQSLDGLSGVIRQAIDYRIKADDFRPLSVFPLPSRVEMQEKDLKDRWRANYQREFEVLLKDEYQIDNCDLTDYFNAVVVPHTSYYAYGESIAVLDDRLKDALSLGAAYERFFDRLIHFDAPWELPERTPQATPTLGVSAPARVTEPLYDAFLSYAKADQGDVATIEARLSELGLRCYFDKRDLLAGEDVAQALGHAMMASRAVLVFFGPSGIPPWSDQSSFSALESYAKQPNKRIIPVLLPGTSPDTLLSTFLGRFQAVEIRSLRDLDAFQRIARAVLATRPDKYEAPSVPPVRSRFFKWISAALSAAVLASAAVGFFGLRHISGCQSSQPNPTPDMQTSTIPTAVASQAWCYQELGTVRSGAWDLKAGQYGVYCHGAQTNCVRASAGAELASACVQVDNLQQMPWAKNLSPNGLYGSSYALNLNAPIPSPLPPIEPGDPKAAANFGVIVSSNPIWQPEKPGGSSAQAEVERLRAKGLENIREYFRNGYYATVLTYPANEKSRATAAQKIMNTLGWNSTLLVDLGKWCRNPVPGDDLQVGGVVVKFTRCASTNTTSNGGSASPVQN